MAKTALDFRKVNSMPALGSLTAGTIYFDNSDHLIKVATGESTYTTFAGVQSASWDSTSNILTIVNPDGSNLAIDFGPCVTDTELTDILNQLRAGIGFAANTNGFGSAGIADTSYLNTGDSSTVIGALKTLDTHLHAVESAAGVTSVGGQTGDITLKNGGSTNGDINLTMNGKQLQAAIVGLGTAAYTDSSAYDASGAAAAVLGTSGDSSTAKTVYGLDKKIDAIKADSSVSLVKDTTAQSGYIASYTISQGGTELGKINIPKDYLVKSGEIKEVTTANQPYTGAAVGDKYIDFTVNTYDTSAGSGTESHIYIPVKELVDVYTGGNTDTINVSVGSNNVISASINTGSVSTTMLDSSVQTALGKANTAVQSVTGETATTDSSYIAVSVEASTTNHAVTLSSHANVTMKDVSTATNASDGLATAYDVQQYVQAYTTEALTWAEFAQIARHRFVDLGLPSGTLWATENIKDASGNELYFAWGETQGYTSGQVGTDKYFAWDDYEFGINDNLSKYNESDEKTELESTDDTATANWGSSWRMPTKEQFEELADYAEYEWTTINGVQGAKFTSTVSGYTDRFLFFPAVAGANGGEFGGVGDYGVYWSASLNGEDVECAWVLDFEDENLGMYDDYRYYGYPVRPVRVN